MSARQTPGPWWLDEDGCIAAGSGDSYKTVAQVLDTDNQSETQANRCLLATAPELLEMLGELILIVEYLAPEQFDDKAHEQEFCGRIRRARELAEKAQGEGNG